MRIYKAILAGAITFSLILFAALTSFASSHREAPMITADPKADATDLYAFVSPDKSDTVTLIATYLPFQEPAGGPNFYGFDDNVLYEIKIDNNGDAMEDLSYQFRFKTYISNKDTFLYNLAPITPDQKANVYQTYTVTLAARGSKNVLGKGLPVAPPNIGAKSTPNYNELMKSAVKKVQNAMVFSGPADDPFFIDLGGTFDLLTIRKLPGNAGGGVDGLAGYNVNAIAIQIPISVITSKMATDAKDPNAVIGVWTTASRRSINIIRENKPTLPIYRGKWVQVSRLGAPLVNEAVIPLGQKDVWNSSKPKDDAQFAHSVADPEVGKLLKALYNIQVPPQGAFGSKDERDDLIAIFLTGITGLNQPANVKPSEQLRLNVKIPVTAMPDPLGVLGGDTQGYPNGRRLADDVTDITLRAVAGTIYPLFHPDFKADQTGAQLGDGVDTNDKEFSAMFPYLAAPHSGLESMPHPGAVK